MVERSGFSAILILILVALIAAVAFGIRYFDPENPRNRDFDRDRENTRVEMQREGGQFFLFDPPHDCNSNPNPVFTHNFTDLDTIAGIDPIGDVGAGSPGRSYITVKSGQEAPIYSPTDATLDIITFADVEREKENMALVFGQAVKFII